MRFSHEWQVLLVKFIVKPTIYVKEWDITWYNEKYVIVFWEYWIVFLDIRYFGNAILLVTVLLTMMLQLRLLLLGDFGWLWLTGIWF